MRSVAHSVLFVVLLIPATFGRCRDDMLWHYRNLGKAFYENSATQYDAVEMFKRPWTWCQIRPRSG
jgi:hypothetical protein